MAHTSESSWSVYILMCADGTLYCGVTTDLERRIAEHNGTLPGGARYTRSRRPVRLAASAACTDRSAACTLEARIKRLPRAEKIAFLRAFVAN
ncbi:GIY-YIG nuclease family protein [Oceanidesulfovibrio indonesiensis]|uniref:GIY-YIG nuclease family protein n=1 Tax=Oceanidesulfovibrio indonesiensis TaxID=54767 RepID=A0A7M3MFW2_9BACT|nr:GIY-YIG nuclease family protein [Oceanidesulfovibrio indonesiensis]TVM17931.1 GIY-YIG nuclease family protein [Oceanidesulfovibrio indonesiensis]